MVETSLAEVPSAFQRMVKEYYKKSDFEQLPFKFPEQEAEDDHIPYFHIQSPTIQTTTRRIMVQSSEEIPIPTIFEDTALNATQEVTANTTNTIFGGEMKNDTMIVENVTSIIDEIFGTNLNATEVDVTDSTIGVETSTESTAVETLKETTHGKLIVLGVIICVLIVFIVIGIAVYFHKKRNINKMRSMNIYPQAWGESGQIASFSKDLYPNFIETQTSAISETCVTRK